jgi:hypothetical protein
MVNAQAGTSRPGAVEGKQVDASARVLEHRVFLSDDQQVITEDIDPLPQRSLKSWRSRIFSAARLVLSTGSRPPEL